MPLLVGWVLTGLKVLIWDLLVVALLAGIVKIAVGFGLAYVLSALAIGTIAYKGVSFSVDWVLDSMSSALSRMDDTQFQILSMVATRMQLDEALSVIFTAFATAMALWTFKGAWGAFMGQSGN